MSRIKAQQVRGSSRRLAVKNHLDIILFAGAYEGRNYWGGAELVM